MKFAQTNNMYSFFGLILLLFFLVIGYLYCVVCGIMIFRKKRKLRKVVLWSTIPAVVICCVFCGIVTIAVPLFVSAISSKL